MAAAFKPAMPNFTILIMACITRSELSESALLNNSPNRFGTICQETP
jgi:hypothetical protein